MSTLCPQCGAPMEEGRPCPQCLLKLGLTDTETTIQETAPPPGFTAHSASPHSGERIDHYRLLKVLGQGGMGIVYLAEQEQPIQRRAALKLIKPGFASPEAVVRFERERQALALMEHPNIAHVYDAGATEVGQPYFVMEYVPGPSITTYCDQNRLPNRDRLKLFREVCLALHHAHQKGVIHLDIKPSNVLVTEQDGKPVPKVIDFGVAKAIDQQRAGQTLFTQHGILAGTPEYMSPEQANLDARDVDASSDVYSLGVLLYELLVGALPFDPKELRKRGLAEILRIIREDDPVPLTSRLRTLPTASEIAHCRNTSLGALSKQLSGELDWMTRRAMEKDRRRRYNAPAEFAGDIEHYLNNDPVIASPPSRLYRIKKFISKHRWPVAAAAAVLAALCVGLATSTFLYFTAERAKQEAGRQREDAQQRGAEAISERIEAQKQKDRAEQEARNANSAAATAIFRENEAQWKSYVANLRAAEEYLQTNELAEAQQILLQCEPTLRGWEWRYLWSRADPSVGTLYAAEPVHSFGFSRDGAQILLAMPSHIDVWNSSTFKRLAAYQVSSSKMSPDGTLVLSDTSLQLVDPATGRSVLSLDGPNIYRPTAVFSPDSSRLAIGFRDSGNSVWIWSTKSGERLTTLTDNGSAVETLAFSQDNAEIAAGLTDGTARIWDTASGRSMITIPPAPERATAQKRVVMEYDATSNRFIEVPAARGARRVTSIAFSPGKRELGLATADSLRVVEVPTGRVTVDLLRRMAKLAFVSDDMLAVSGGNGAEILDAHSGKQIASLGPPRTGAVYGIEERAAVSPDGKLILFTPQTRVVRVLARDLLGTKPVPTEQSFDISAEHVAAIVQGRVQLSQLGSTNPPHVLNGQAMFRSARFSPNGELLATATADGRQVIVWRVSTYLPVAEISSAIDDPMSLTFSQDGQSLAFLGTGGMVHVWDIKSVRELARLGARVRLFALSPDGARAAMSGDSGRGSLQIFAVRSGYPQLSISVANSPLRILDGKVYPWEVVYEPYEISFSPDGKQIAVGGANGIWLSNAMTGVVVSRLEGVPIGSRRAAHDSV